MAGQTSFADFTASTRATKLPPAGLSPALQALWFDAKGDWDAAHGAAQSDDSTAAAWVHAYLHRKEGDAGNAGYWYRRAAQPLPKLSIEDEWKQIVRALLAEQT